MLRYYKVFNVDQTEGISENKIPKIEKFDFNAIKQCEDIAKNMPLCPEIKHNESIT